MDNGIKEHLSIERMEKGFKVSVSGQQHQVFIMLGVLVADICETYKISPYDLGKDLPRMVMMAVKGGELR